MSDFAICVLGGLMIMNLTGTLLAHRTLWNRHDRVMDELDEEGRWPVHG